MTSVFGCIIALITENTSTLYYVHTIITYSSKPTWSSLCNTNEFMVLHFSPIHFQLTIELYVYNNCVTTEVNFLGLGDSQYFPYY